MGARLLRFGRNYKSLAFGTWHAYESYNTGIRHADVRATILGLGTQILRIPAQRKFISAECHSHSNPHKPPKNCGAHNLHARINFNLSVLFSSIPID